MIRCSRIHAVGFLALSSLLVPAIPAVADEGAIPTRPEQLQFGPLEFIVPQAAEHRHVLANGLTVYIVEDHALPLVDISIQVKAGGYLDPADQVGLAALTADLVRDGGTQRLAGQEFDEEVDFLAVDIATRGGGNTVRANLNCISPVLDSALDLFFEMLRTPGFEESRLDVAKTTILEQLKQRNDDPQSILQREWGWLLEGKDYYDARQITGASLKAIGREDLMAFHRRYWHPENMVLAVSGDVETAPLLKNLETRFADWPAEGGSPEAAPWPPPATNHVPTPGLYLYSKDIPQGRVTIGHPAPRQTEQWDHPDDHALLVMNNILGGGGFTSRLVRRIRSEEGLAYSAGSRVQLGSFSPGAFTMFYQSKSDTVALAAKIAYEEMGRIREEPVSTEEFGVAKTSLIETFPRRFETAQGTANLFVRDQLNGRPDGYWQLWRDGVRSVEIPDVTRVAREHLHPDKTVFLVVGDWSTIEAGDADQRAVMKDFFEGRVHRLPQRDPVTLEVMAEPAGQ